MIGVAIADKPTGPFIRWKGNPLVYSHTGCVWPHRGGVALLADARPPNRAIHYSPDGLQFQKTSDIDQPISDPGVYSPDAFTNTQYGQGVSWGLSQLYEESKLFQTSAYLVRWDCSMLAPARE